MRICRLLLTFAAVGAAAGSSVFAAFIPTNATANLVLGQGNFTTNESPLGGLNGPSGVTLDPTTGKVFVADELNHRVLRYPSVGALRNNTPPEAVFGQLNFSNTQPNRGGTADASSLSAPRGLMSDAAGRLWVADSGNNRVLLFVNASGLDNGAPASRVFGQGNFTVTTAAAAVNKLAAPSGVWLDPANTLWVADTGSHRVIGFKNAPDANNGPDAFRVLGQGNFTTAVAATSQTGLFAPRGIYASAGALWVADTSNNRVLYFPNPPSLNGAPANFVVGQKDYTTQTAGVSSIVLNSPTSLVAFGSDLWVSDSLNNRVLRFRTPLSFAVGTAPASVVVGQTTFTGALGGLSAQKLNLFQNQIWMDTGGSLWVADQLNNRIVRFSPVNVPPTVTINGPATRTTRNAKITLKGTAASADATIDRVSYNLRNQGFLRAKGTTSWSATFRLSKGKNRVVVQSVDSNGQASAPATVTITLK